MPRRAKQAAIDTLWDEVDEVPRAGLPDARKIARRQRFYRVVVWSCVILTPLLLLTVLSRLGTAATPNAASSPPSVDTPGRTAATLEVDQWLAQTPSPLPGGVVLSWDGGRRLPKASAPTGQKATAVSYSVEVDSFTLLDSTGQTYRASVAVAIDPRGGAVAMGGPSLIPDAPPADDNWNTGNPWPGLTPVTNIPDPVTQAVSGWASAYTSGDANKLRLAVGDPSGSHSYMPLSNISAATATVTQAALIGSPSADEMVVQVTLGIIWNGQAAPQPGATPNQGPQTTMDLLVGRASTAAPVVLAWGAPGTGPTLRPYQNAITAGPRPVPTGGPVASGGPTPIPPPTTRVTVLPHPRSSSSPNK